MPRRVGIWLVAFLVVESTLLGHAQTSSHTAKSAPPPRASSSNESSGWVRPAASGISLESQGQDAWKVTSTTNGEFALESDQILPAMAGDSFEISIRIKVDPDMRALPELVCYDNQQKEIPAPYAIGRGVPLGTTNANWPNAHKPFSSLSRLGRSTPYVTTNWQWIQRTFAVWPGTTMVRARIRGEGRGVVDLAGFSMARRRVDPYETGALVDPMHPFWRKGLMLESNHGIVNRRLVSREDRDGDGRWALVTQNLDELTKPVVGREDWRSSFEDNPNVILWSDGTVLKSDTVTSDRPPSRETALHFRMKMHPGPYSVRMGDPGRAVAVSIDGTTWHRHEGGNEIELGDWPLREGIMELWIDACYRDPVSAGPAYFDYVRLAPTVDPASIEPLFTAALRLPAPLTRGTADQREVPIAVEVPPSGSATQWPVRCGLPVPQGELLSPEQVAIFDASGKQLPRQSRTMARWPDGSIKWLHLDFMHDLKQRSDGRYVIRYGNRLAADLPAVSVQTSRKAGGVEVDTGALQFLVSDVRFGIVENVRLASGELLQAEPIAAVIKETDGRIWDASLLPVSRIAVEQAGPLHTVIVVETQLAASGKPASGFYHRARIHAYAGSPVVQVDYFVANTDSREAVNMDGSMASKVAVSSVALQLKPSPAIAGVVHALGAASSAGALIQKAEEEAEARSGLETKSIRTRLPGWLALDLEDGSSLHVGLPAFREQFPKAFRWGPGGLEIDLWAEEGGVFEWIEGVGKTHQLTLVYGAGASASGELLTQGPVMAFAAPEWYAGSGAFGAISKVNGAVIPAVEDTLKKHISESVVGRVGLGFENYGDHSSNGYVKGTFLWDNNEYDLPAGCLVHFVRTGDRDALKLGLAGALHYLDVDTIHYSSAHAGWAGAHHVHSHATFGHHTAQPPDFSHAGYVQGLIWYSYLTGEPIGILGARGIADWSLAHLGIHTLSMERILGHPLMTLNDVYEATGEQKYLRGSAQLVDQALKWEHPGRGGFLAPIAESPAYYSGATFCSGVVSAALLKFNSWAHLPEVDALLDRLAQWTLTDMWKPPGGIVDKGGSPSRLGNAQNISSHSRLMADVYRRTKDPFYLVVPRELMAKGFGEDAREIGTRRTGLVFNYLPWLISALKDIGDPVEDPELELVCGNEKLTLAPGATAEVRLRVKNIGRQPVEDFRLSFHLRRDFTIKAVNSIPTGLQPGESIECVFALQAPIAVNLTCDYNAMAYGHWSMLYQRGEHARLAHRWMEITLARPRESRP